ncbi:MAG: hypothetical protein K8I30_12635 [Anaerolineae bacterium]|nr:hypothetical protein [Anaerolineae bacterium]
MLKRLSLFTSGAVSALAILNLLAGLLGTLRPPHPALAGFSACSDPSLPCWNGIIPGVTTSQETRQIMAFAVPGVSLFDDLTDSYTLYFILPQPSPICVALFQMDQQVVGRVQLQVCRETDVQVGDLTGTLGLPERLVMIPPQNLVYGYVAVNAEGWRTPFQPTSQIAFMNVLQPHQIGQSLYGWHGFVPLWRYCQLEPKYPLCR